MSIPEQAIDAAAQADCCPDGDCVPTASYCGLKYGRARIERILTAALPFMGVQWQPIETAPKDGTVFIYQDGDGAVSTCSWQADDGGFDWYDIHGDQTAYPRRWMPLPAASVASPAWPAPGDQVEVGFAYYGAHGFRTTQVRAGEIDYIRPLVADQSEVK